MPTVFEPAQQDPNFSILWQQYLARLRNTEQLIELVGDSSGLEGDFESLEDVVAALVTAIGKLNTVTDITSVTTDYDLSVGETVKINITGQTTALHVAVEDGVYEIDMLFEDSTFGADQNIVLQPNNTTYGGEFKRIRLAADTTIATDEVDTATSEPNVHVFALAFTPRQIKARLIISGMISNLMTEAQGVNSTNRRIEYTGSNWPGSAAHTSLGTLDIGENATGVVYVKRIA